MGWWVLVDYWASDDRIPRAIGPYPSEEFCRLAARRLMPTERRFWPENERQAAEAEDALRQEARKAEIARLWEESGRTAGWLMLSNRSSVKVDESGNEVGWSGNTTILSSPLPPNPITGCVYIPPTVASHEG